jgi:hypothetical protein
MKKHLSLFGLLAAVGCFAQQFVIDRFKTSSVNRESSGGTYRLTGVIGQPEAGVLLTNSQCSVQGGLWILPTVVQMPGAPLLSIRPAPLPGRAILSWWPETTGFVLQENASPMVSNWTFSLSGGTNPVTVPVTFPVRCYRLIKP